MSGPIKPFTGHVHTSSKTPYAHTDYFDAIDKLHLKLDESEFLAKKYNISLKPTNSVLPSELKELLNRK